MRASSLHALLAYLTAIRAERMIKVCQHAHPLFTRRSCILLALTGDASDAAGAFNVEYIIRQLVAVPASAYM